MTDRSTTSIARIRTALRSLVQALRDNGDVTVRQTLRFFP